MKYIEGIPTPEQLAVINVLERHKNVSSEDTIRKMNEKDVSKFIMAMNNRDRVVGELRYMNVPHPYVQTLSVDPRYRNQGVGSGLLNNVLSKDEITTIHVLDWNANAKRLYERLGFELANEQDPKTGKNLPLLVYVPQKNLAPIKIIE